MKRVKRYYWVRFTGLPIHILNSFSLDENDLENERKIEKMLSFQSICLQKISHSAVLQNGFLFASPSFLNRLQKYQNKDIHSFRKKEKQTERTLLQFVNRVCAKTSPFSSFSPVACFDSNEQVFCSPKQTFRLTLKPFIVQQLSQKKQPFVRLNPSIIETATSFHFLLEQDGALQQKEIERDAIIALIFHFIQTSKNIIYKDLQGFILSKIEAVETEVDSFLEELFLNGFLVDDFSNASTSIQKDWQKTLASFYQKEALSIEDLGLLKNSIDATIDTPFLYQDCAYFPDSEAPLLPTDFLTKIRSELQNLVQILKPFQSNEKQENILICLERNFADSQKIPFNLFAKAYFSMEKQAAKPLDISPKWKEYILELSTDNPMVLSLDFNQMEAFISDSSEIPPTAFDFLVQFSQKEATLQKAVINGISLGYGKLTRRFFPLFEKDVLEEQIYRNERFQGEEIWVENSTFSSTHLEEQAVLLSHKIANGFQGKATEISLSDLEIHWDLASRTYQLIEAKSEKTVRILDLNIQHPSQQSLLYQLLNGFGFEVPRLQPFLDFVHEITVQKRANSIYFCPRIELHTLVLQRATWWLPSKRFPIRFPKESDAAFFQRMHHSLKKEGIPIHFFICLSPLHFPSFLENAKHNKSAKTIDYKPQYLNRNSPIHLLLLERLLKRAASYLLITEMFPAPEEVVGKRANEWLV